MAIRRYGGHVIINSTRAPYCLLLVSIIDWTEWLVLRVLVAKLIDIVELVISGKKAERWVL